jgi:hypothetical protein
MKYKQEEKSLLETFYSKVLLKPNLNQTCTVVDLELEAVLPNN